MRILQSLMEGGHQAINDDQFQVQMGYYIGTRRKRKKRAKKR